MRLMREGEWIMLRMLPMLRRELGSLRKSEDGAGTLEVILIIAVVIIIALLFKDWIIALVQDLMSRADEQADTIFDA